MSEIIAAFQGEPGAYSEQAALEFLGRETRTLPCPNFDVMFEAVESGSATHALAPVENSLAGSVHRNYDLMLRHNLHIVGEYHLRVQHCLMALPGVKVDEIERIHSHPQALAQCEAGIQRLGAQPVVEADTAGSARLLVERGDRLAGALASRRAAQVYGLEILYEGMEDNPLNYTRFLALSPHELHVKNPEKAGYKTSIVFSLNNKPGVLFKALSVFALRDIDLTKIESRPIQGQPWEYVFYIDFAGHAEAQNSRRALQHLEEIAPFLRLLGSYPRHKVEEH